MSLSCKDFIGIDALFIDAPNVYRTLCLSIDALFIGAHNVCRGFVSVS